MSGTVPSLDFGSLLGCLFNLIPVFSIHRNGDEVFAGAEGSITEQTFWVKAKSIDA